ncbi:DNA primase [Thalassolituus marinus]|uniref:Toprim domain-containing protein n=1 Tax=Thalassolituus marinus TaxID=671053 RepID=A0ABS7ZW35_9GAMM|nr:toprim domain-containing protein [Thalassolituus marinus]MCA6065433.1 toprim domain-containing protein [Thalassolituus marinus]
MTSPVELIKSRLDIVKVAQSLGIEAATYKKNICCPLHDDSTPSFRFYEGADGGSFVCFSHCDLSRKHGNDMFALVMAINGVDFKGALAYLASLSGVELSRKKKSPADEALGLAQYFFRKNLPESGVEEYLASRGFCAAVIEKFGIGYAPPGSRLARYGHQQIEGLLEVGLVREMDGHGVSDLLRRRLTIPIHDRHGGLAGFAGRLFGDPSHGDRKYMNSPESRLFKKGDLLYNMHRCRRGQTLIVTEGYLDVMALDQVGFHNSVCTMGTALTESHISSLVEFSDDLVFMFDGDKAGKRAAWAAATHLICHTDKPISFRFALLDSVDPHEYLSTHSPADMEALLDAAPPLSDFITREIEALSDCHGDRPEDLMRLLSRFEDFINRAPSGIFRDILADRVASITKAHARRIPLLELSSRDQAFIAAIEELASSFGYDSSVLSTDKSRITFKCDGAGQISES